MVAHTPTLNAYCGQSVLSASSGSAAPDPQGVVGKGYKNCLRRTYLLRWQSASGQTASDQADAMDLSCGQIRAAPQARVARLHSVLALQNRAHDLGLPFLAIDVGLTYAGLEQLHLQPQMLQVFRRKSPAFQAGAWARAAQHLGDTGSSDRRFWSPAYSEAGPGGPVHLVVLVHLGFAHTDKGAETGVHERIVCAFEQQLWSALSGQDVPALGKPVQADWVEEAAPLDRDGTVWFGYKDGITRPHYLQGAQGQPYTGGGTHAWGELLLGHARNTGDNPYADLGLAPQVSLAQGTALKSLSDQEAHRLRFFRNSSFGVLRRMQQDVQGFDAWVQLQASKTGWPAAWVKAKVMGRVPVPTSASGALPTSQGLPPGTRLTPQMQPQHLVDASGLRWLAPGQEAGYRQAASEPTHQGVHQQTNQDLHQDVPPDALDLKGEGCPYASHIRRMNPRDDPVVPFFARPLLRRSLPYGAPHDGDKGMAGLFFCSDIERQFEHVLGRWANGPVLGLADGSRCKDPVIGNHDHDGGKLALRSAQTSTRLGDFEQAFVHTRGTLYAWFPSLTVLCDLQAYVQPPPLHSAHGHHRLL